MILGVYAVRQGKGPHVTNTPSPDPRQPAAPGYQASPSGTVAGGKTNTLAIVSLIASLAGLITGLGFIVGIICGHIALSQIKKTGENGRGMALAGTIIGYVGIAISIIITIISFAVLGAALSTVPMTVN